METKPRPKVTIAVPIWKEPISSAWLAHFQNIKKPSVCEYLIERSVGIHRGRRNIVKNASGEYIFFLDVDVLIPSDALIKLLEDKKNIVSGLYFKKTYPHNPLMFRKVNEESYIPILDYGEGLISVDGIGLGCCLVKRDVFDKIPEPWFELPPLSDLTEDLFFCDKAKKAGFSIFVDTGVKCGHIGETIFDERYFLTLKHLMK